MGMTKVDKGRLFEERVLAVLERLGYDAALTARGADGGVDVLVRMGGEGAPVPVQCKDAAGCVGAPVAHSLHGVAMAMGAPLSVLVASNGFSKECRAFAERVGMRRVSGDLLAVAERLIGAAAHRRRG